MESQEQEDVEDVEVIETDTGLEEGESVLVHSDDGPVTVTYVQQQAG